MTDGKDVVFQLWHLNDDDLNGVFEKTRKGIYMVPARTWTGWFHKALLYSHAVLFAREKNIVLIATAQEYVGILEAQKNLGFLVRTNHEKSSNGN